MVKIIKHFFVSEQQDKNQTQNMNYPKESVQIVQKEPMEYIEREVGDQQIIGDKTRNESEEVEEQQITGKIKKIKMFTYLTIKWAIFALLCP